MTTARPIIFLVGSPDAHVSAQQTWNNLYRCHQLGPELFRWVYPMPLYGPNRLGIMSTDDICCDIALSSAPEVTSPYVTTWVRVGVNRAQALYDTVVSSVFHTLLFDSIEFWTMYSASFS